MANQTSQVTPEAAIIQAATAAHGRKKQVADALGVSPGFISQLATGRRPVPWDKAEALAAAIGTTPDQISSEYREMFAGTERVPSQPARFDDATMSQAVDLLYLLADLRPDDPRFRRLTWPMIQMAAEGIRRRQAGVEMKAVIAELLSKIK